MCPPIIDDPSKIDVSPLIDDISKLGPLLMWFAGAIFLFPAPLLTIPLPEKPVEFLS